MNNFTFKTWLRITAWALAIHIILIAISILEVFIYSLLYPIQEQEYYSEHAQLTGPYISIFFGFFIFYLVARFLTKNLQKNKLSIALLLPAIYTLMDFLIVHFSGVNWKEHLPIFLISALVKTMGSVLGAFLVGSKN